MKSRIKIRDKNNIPKAIRSSEELDGTVIQVGVLQDGQIGMIAAVQEFGANVPVTPKMRGYLASQGLYLKATTTQIRIPERSYIRAGWDQNEPNIVQKYADLLGKAVANGVAPEALLDALGLESQGALQKFARDLRNPANHPFTVEQKGSSNPLVDTGNLIANIEYNITN